ncbi:MAG: HpcH/HpaI aldolase family protein [Chloroflexota bacterium]
MKENKLKTMIEQDRAAIGTWVTLTDPAIVELVGLAGYDFAIIDQEHACLGNETVENMIRAADLMGLPSLVRVGQNSENAILRVLESGASGVIVPHVMDRESAERAVRYTKYEPMGIHGIAAMSRAARWATVDLAEHIDTFNAQSMVVPMIEDVEGVDNIADILSVKGVDVVLIGPADLARAYGVTKERNPPVVKDAIEHVAVEAKKAGIPLGLSMNHPAFNRNYQQLLELGVRFITASTDAVVLLKAWRENLRRAREA